MRREWRKVLAIGVLFLAGVGRAAAPQDIMPEGRALDPLAVQLTIELNWAFTGNGVSEDAKGGPGSNLRLELSEGRVVEATAWPPRAGVRALGWGPAEGGGWRLGDAASGTVRARIQTAVDAKLIVRRGDQVVSVPVAAVLERPQRTPSPSPLTVAVERMAWDTLSIELGAPAVDGIVAPGAELPVSVGMNILWPETTDVTVRYSAVLRPAGGGEVIARQDRQEVLPTNRAKPSMRILTLPAPPVEGAYTVEVQAAWEPVPREGSRLGRLIRRRKSATAAISAVRRVSLVVLGPAAPAVARAAARGSAERAGHRGEVEVDSVDLTRPRLLRPLASGRAPLAEPGRSAWAVPAAALIEPSGRDRLRGWLHGGAEADRLERVDGSGLAWAAVGLKAAHPDRPHRLTLTVKGGEPAALGVALIEAGDARPDHPRPRVILDACASGPPVLEEGPPLAFSWVVWPGAGETVLVLVNRSPDAAVRLGSVALTELDDLPGPPPHEPELPPSRALGLYLDDPHALDRFGGESGVVDDWTAATNLAKYLSYCGATAVVLPESLAGRSNRRALGGQAVEDTVRPTRLGVIRRVLERQGCSLWLELAFDGPGALPNLPPPDSAEAVRRGLVRLDGSGNAVGAAYHPLHPDVRRAMRRRIAEALTRDRGPSVPAPDPRVATGLVIRLGRGPTLLGTPDTGVDDATYARFVRETFSPETARGVPGLGTDDSNRFAVRLRYLAGAGRMPWLTWRSRAIASLYTEFSAAAQEAVPGAMLAVVTPALDGGPAGSEARRVDLAGLAPGQAWRSVGLDLASWPGGPTAPAVLRGVTLSNNALAHDLATSPDLDAIVATRARRGLLLTVDGSTASPLPRTGLEPSLPPAPAEAESSPSPGEVARGSTTGAGGPPIWLSALPLGDGATADEPLGHALAAYDAQWVFLSATAASGHEERLRRFAVVLGALPVWPASPEADPRGLPFGAAVRSRGDATRSFLAIANDSPYPIRLACLLEAPESAVVEDLGRGLRLAPTAEPGGRNLVLDVLPFGVSAIRIGAPGVRVASLTAYPSEAVLMGMKARSRELALQLARLNQGLTDAVEPANPGFEPSADSKGASSSRDAHASPAGEALPPLPNASDPGVTTAGGLGPKAADRSTVPVGWRLEANRAGASGSGANPEHGAIAIDRENPHSGQGSLRISAPAVPASVVSEPFAPIVQSSLTIQAFFRCSPANATVRVWIEGESGGQPYIRRSELGVSTVWEARAVRASDLPSGGLDSARLRFEMMTPGVLWIDDLRITGDGIAKSARLNAQRTMLAALQAYRERRYADFARLAASHWVRHSAGPTARLARAGEPPANPGPSTDAAASALPSDRKLR